ncbi:MAG: DUF4830 domain-containing protein [Ruminococcus sp.]|nr:DUF4830 domain-containing protein [Ruminococcus sp.]
MKKFRLFLFTAFFGALLAALLIPDKHSQKLPESAHVAASTTAERIDYFASHGWEVGEIAGKSITIPENFSSAYEEYAVMQDKQGMPLREYAGREATLYVYEVKNYSPESKKMLAELLVCNDIAVASMVYSEDGGSLRLAVS